MNKPEPPPQVGFNQPISFNFMQGIQKSAIQSNKPKVVDTGNVFGFDSSSNIFCVFRIFFIIFTIENND